MNPDEVKKLATLARIEIDDAEAERLTQQFEAILGYVADVRKAVGETEENMTKSSNFGLKNVMREDTNPHESGVYTEKLLAEAPDRSGNLIKVKNIL
ncbi:MAG: Asp-tRNA(Asn)/Glu-tRNA(Gln) amidotransferase subunit GatC [Parcubacteria group bacterium]